MRGDPLHLLVGEGGRSESRVRAGVEGEGEDIALVMILGRRRRRRHIFLALRDDLWRRRRVPLELELRGLDLVESVVGEREIPALQLARQPLELFIREAGGRLRGRLSDVIGDVTDVPLLRLGLGVMRSERGRVDDISLERGGCELSLLALFVDGLGPRLQ